MASGTGVADRAGEPILEPDVTDPDTDDSGFRLFGEASLQVPDDDEHRLADPADSVVAVGDVPPVEEPVRRRGIALPPMPTDRARAWIVTGVLTLIGGILRFWQLGWRTDGGTPLFDEKYYAVQAAEMIRTGGVEDNQAYGVIVHPPLGKQLIALGEMIFGYNPVGWRFASAVCGTICILVIIRATRRMTRSTLLGGIAGVLLICDGVSQVMSRTALLDTFVAPFVLGAFACLVVDRDQVRKRLAVAVADGSMDSFSGGVPLGARWWRFAAGFLLGCATACKWNGAYWIIGFAILSVIWDISARKQYGMRHPITAMFRRDFLPSVWSLGIVPVLTYLASYWAWFTSETAWDRHVDAGTSGFLPAGIRSLVTMTLQMLQTTAGILTPTDPADRHPWESKPLAWPMSTRPVLYYLAGGQGTTGCGAGQNDCVQRILLVGTPTMWFLAFFVAAWALWRAIARLDWRYAAVLVAYGFGYIPWLFIWERQMYFFYMTPLAPFLVIGITLILGDVLGRGARAPARAPAPIEAGGAVPGAAARAVTRRSAGGLVTAPDRTPGRPLARHAVRTIGLERRYLSVAVVALYVGIVAANFIWLWPILVGDPITPARLVAETWIPSWG
jgi:dolichyl-phosphate-mannose--protein O-mannosyl transferase